MNTMELSLELTMEILHMSETTARLCPKRPQNCVRNDRKIVSETTACVRNDRLCPKRPVVLDMCKCRKLMHNFHC